MEAAGMDLRKWITNDTNLMEQWKKENFNVHPVHETIKNMKRFILQAVGKIFDPLGLISPFTVRMKYLLQDLWKEEIQWDDPLPTHIEKEWKKWCEELPHLRNIKIPLLVLDSTLLEDDVELHSFSEASKKAYGAAIYLRTKSRNGISVKLVTSKSRVAPLNCVTLPRLELLGALVAARRASKVKKIVNLKRSCLQYHWTDSKIVLFCVDKEFNYNCRNKSKKVGPLTVAKFKESEIKLIKHAQRSLFYKKEIPSNISNLFPFVDGEGIVRVGGRLENASVPYLNKHPAILPKGSKLSKLYVNSLHTALSRWPSGIVKCCTTKILAFEQWRNGKLLGAPAKSGLGPMLNFTKGRHLRQSGFSAVDVFPLAV
ncbi:integrase catalytic domain-containing protein [Trichonephila clavipes]|uniref:Integrase catalytic domain-containing protein n=1 Tax=Trichonephila clavipes TaxID=2585209 RepID=A0A8X6VEN5_TRICX|nr:integrase catalytic domain-containing protein [Trichonephila clavipes]